MGPGKIVGAVTQMRYALLSFIRACQSHSLRVALSSLEVFNVQDTWLHDNVSLSHSFLSL